LPKGTTAIAYADDTLVMTEWYTVYAVQDGLNIALNTVSDHIRGLGLRLSVGKTQAMGFTRYYKAAETLILLEEAVQLGISLKYLGVVL